MLRAVADNYAVISSEYNLVKRIFLYSRLNLTEAAGDRQIYLGKIAHQP